MPRATENNIPRHWALLVGRSGARGSGEQVPHRLGSELAA